MTTEKIDKAISEEVNTNVEAVAASAAAQVDQANKDAEAIARAAVQTEHVARLQAMDEENRTWRATMETRLAETAAQSAAQAEALRLSISEQLSKLAPPLPIAVVETPESASVEQGHNSKPTDTTAETTQSPSASQPARRERRAI